MDAIVSSIITPVVQSLMGPVKKHFGYIFSSTKYVKDMKEKMEQLSPTEQYIRHNLDEAVARNHEVPPQVSSWLKRFQEMNTEAERIPNSGIGCFDLAKRYKAGKQSCDILKKIEDLEKQKSEIKFTNTQKPLAEVVSTSAEASTSTQNNFESRDSIFKAALNSLQSNDESQKMIALCGTGGVGKTTMMEKLKKAVEDSKTFDWVVKVVVGESTDTIALQRAIAEYIQEDLKETDKSARADRLGKIFEGKSKQGKKTLVIMDDLWSEVKLELVGLSPLPNGFKVLVTSRDKKVCTTMGVKPNSIFSVDLLSNTEAKALFFDTVGEGDNHPFEMMGEGIVKKCRGLPIAIVTIARSLRGGIEEEWKRALSRLEEDNLEGLKDITHRIFEMSFENLKEDNDKTFFLLSGLFPDDFDIRIEDLLRYGWGLGFFKNVKNLAEARSDMKICINNLISANLLIESEEKGCVKMHDLVRAFVLSNFSKVKQASIVNRENKSEERLTKHANESYDRVLLKCTGMTKFPKDFNFPNLSMLMLMDGNELLQFPEDIYERMEKLVVMSCEDMYIPSLPGMSEHSARLRTLCLRSCSFINDDVSFIGSLSNLEVLSFIDCKLSWLPSTIGKLKKLKLLDLTACVELCIDAGVFENLASLKELYIRADEDSRIRFTDVNCHELVKLSQGLLALELEFFENKIQPKCMSFKSLERFRISIGCQLAGLEHDEDYSFRNTIQFVGECNELLECKISDIFKKTEELHLQVNGMNQLEDFLTQNSFSNLTVLHISECADLTYLFTTDVASGLEKLERLTISDCPVMRTLVAENSRVEVIRFQKLSFLSLEGLPNFTSIYPSSHDMSDMQSLLNKKVMIPKLEELVISGMESLKQIWSSETTFEKDSVSIKLRKIIVSSCDNLLNLFPCNPLPLLSQLEELEVEDCGSIEVLFNIDFESVCRMGEYISRLRSIKADKLGKLKELWRMKGVNNSDVPISCFKGVESITIGNCSMFKDIFTPTTSNFDLVALTNYVVRNYNGEEINATLKGEISEMDDHMIPNVTYPSYLLQTFHHLQYLKLENDKRVEEVVFDMDSQPPLLLPYLKDLKLLELKEMSQVWKCNWSKFLIPQHQPLQLPFKNLTNIHLENCHKIKHLFSPLMAEFLSNLKYVYINKCDGIQEVVSWRDDENASTFSQKNTTFFPCLETLELRRLTLLNRIDGGDIKSSRSNTISSNITVHHQSQSGQVIGACWSFGQYPRKIVIEECPASSRLVPWYAVGQMSRLEELSIKECETMMEVFESEGSAHGTTLTSCQTLETIPSALVPQLSNLKDVYIYKCDLLSHVFTFSTIESLKQLKELRVEECKAIQVIVKEDNGTSLRQDVVFPHLKTLELKYLPSLEAFFLGMNEFQWPALEYVKIDDCPRLMTFTLGESKSPKLKYIHTMLGKHSVECGLNFDGTVDEFQNSTLPSSSSSSLDGITISKGMPYYCSFHNLMEINIYWDRNVETTLIPSHALPQLQKLQKIHLRLIKVKEVFEVVGGGALEGSGFSESPTPFQIPNLTHVNLEGVFDLKYLWKSNQWMVLQFPNLTTVVIAYCNSLEHVFTCSMVASLVQLQHLHIYYCNNIEVIVKEEEEECDGKVNEIINLPRLKSLLLFGLKNLKGFCLGKDAFSLPALDTLQIKKCPAITVFTKGSLSTPELKVIDTDFGKWYVKPDLNSFINTKQQQEV